jgi:hypothetical protein
MEATFSLKTKRSVGNTLIETSYLYYHFGAYKVYRYKNGVHESFTLEEKA